MDLSFEDLTRLGCRQFSVDYMSMAADVLRMEFCGTLLEHAPLPFAAGDALRLMQGEDCVFRGWVTSVEPAMDTQVWVTRVAVQNVVAVLDALPVEVSSYETEQRLESARELVQLALGAARRCALLVGAMTPAQKKKVHTALAAAHVFTGLGEHVTSFNDHGRFSFFVLPSGGRNVDVVCGGCILRRTHAR